MGMAWVDTGTSSTTNTATSGSTWTGLYGYKTYDPSMVKKRKAKPRAETIVPWKHPVKRPDLIAELQHEFNHWAKPQMQELFGA